MKKTGFTLGINFRNSFYLLFILLCLFMQSCKEEKEIQGSIDASHQRYSGYSYSFPSPDASDVGFNIGVTILTSGGAFNSSNGSGSFKRKNSERFMNSYAGNLHGPAAFYNTEIDKAENRNTNNTKISSDFMSHIRYMGGIEFVEKNSKDGGTKIKLNYLQLPLYALYWYQLQGAGNIFGGLGPYFAYGIGGKIKSSFNGQSSERKSFDKTNGLKPFDAGLGITAGYKMPNSFSFSLAYDLGFVNIERNAFGDKTRNRCISFNVSYPLDKIIKK